jgi:DNA-3-methyladenine glycosylase II
MITLEQETPMEAPADFTIVPSGPFSLELASGHAFGPRVGVRQQALMRLAFCADSFQELAGVVLRQEPDGTVRGQMHGARDVAAVRSQVARILSLDHDGGGWPDVGRRDPVLGALQAAHDGFRPVLFHSPYEAAAWAVIAGHRAQRQAAGIRRHLCEAAGGVFDLAGERFHAFPAPARLLEVESAPGLAPEQVRRLHAVAEAALEGRLDASRLRAMDPEAARAEVRSIPGIGPFYSGLVVIRGAGPVDAVAAEPRSLKAVSHYYRMVAPTADDLARIAEAWRPYRTWAMVLVRFAAHREGVA